MTVNRRMPRVQEIVLPVLRSNLPGVTCGSWISDVDYRSFPIINIRRLGGITRFPNLLDEVVIEMTAYHTAGLIECEDLLMDAREIIFNMVEQQTVTDAGYLHSYFETLGPTQFDSPYEDTWRVQNLIQLGVRPRRTNSLLTGYGVAPYGGGAGYGV